MIYKTNLLRFINSSLRGEQPEQSMIALRVRRDEPPPNKTESFKLSAVRSTAFRGIGIKIKYRRAMP